MDPSRLLVLPRYRWWLVLMALACLLLFVPKPGSLPNDADFTLQASVLEALEGGPLVVKVTLTNAGAKRTSVYECPYEQALEVDCPRSWDKDVRESRMHYFVFDGKVNWRATMEPGDQRTVTEYIHFNHRNIPRGKNRVTLRWPIWEPGGLGLQTPALNQFQQNPVKVLKEGIYKPGKADWVRGKLQAEPKLDLDMDIAPATPKNLAALRDRFLKELDRPDLTRNDARHIAECIVHSRHKELASVVFKLLDCPVNAFNEWRLVEHIYYCHPDAQEADNLLLHYTTRPGSMLPVVPFGYWHGGESKPSFSDSQMKMLLECNNTYVRMLTYLTFPDRCPPQSVAELKAELGSLATLPVIVEKLRYLDDKSPSVREKGTKELKALGKIAEPAIRAHLKDLLSREARRRCEQILADPEPDANLGYTFPCLTSDFGPKGKEILQILAKGPADCRIVQEAQAALRRLER